MDDDNDDRSSNSDNNTNGNNKRSKRSCPYLDTIQRSLLDFDQLYICSETLQTTNVYCCLVCGKFLAGKTSSTPAHVHSLQHSHYVYMHLSHGTFHCLPDNYTFDDGSLHDIRYNWCPTFTQQQIQQLYTTNTTNTTTTNKIYRDWFGKPYQPGLVGIHNLDRSDAYSVLLHAFSHVPKIRDYFLLSTTNTFQPGTTAPAFAQTMRQLWNGSRFVSHVAPHRLLATLKKPSHKQLEIGVACRTLLHQLHIGCGGTIMAGSNKKKRKKKKQQQQQHRSSIIQETFQGTIRVTTRQAKWVAAPQVDVDDRGGSDNEDDDVKTKPPQDPASTTTVQETTTTLPFLLLTCDISEKPLFSDQDGGLVIPQEALLDVLRKKFTGAFVDGVQNGTPVQRKYELQTLPSTLILHLQRFVTSPVPSKNPTIVVFPVKNLNLSEFLPNHNLPDVESIPNLSVAELKATLARTRPELSSTTTIVEKDDLIATVTRAVETAATYDLVANVIHDCPVSVGREGRSNPLQEGTYKVHVRHQADNKWYELRDLERTELMPQQIGVSESCLLVFERKHI